MSSEISFIRSIMLEIRSKLQYIRSIGSKIRSKFQFIRSKVVENP